MYIVKGSLRSRWLCRADVDAAFLQLAHDCAYLCRQQGTSASRKRDRQQWVASEVVVASGCLGLPRVATRGQCGALRREKATRDNGELLVALYQAHASTNTLTAEQNATLQRILAASGKTPVPAR